MPSLVLLKDEVELHTRRGRETERIVDLTYPSDAVRLTLCFLSQYYGQSAAEAGRIHAS